MSQRYRKQSVMRATFKQKFWVKEASLFQELAGILEMGGKIHWNTVSRNGRYIVLKMLKDFAKGIFTFI